MKKMSLFSKTVKDQIDQHSVISFDIFDTLLLRPYLKPTDLFLHLEKIEKIDGFKEKRIAAEQLARLKKTTEEIKFCDIYRELEQKYRFLQEKELALEEFVLRANPEMLEIINYAIAHGKKVIATSDMYLSKKILSRILENNNISGVSEIFVSCDIGLTKETGNLFKHIIKQLNIKKTDILHIGDNKHSDFNVPNSLGIKSILYIPFINDFIESNEKIKKFKNFDTLSTSIITAIFAQRWAKQKAGMLPFDIYWDKIGYCYAGPVIYAFAKFIENEAIKKNIDHILFIARDGYSIKKVFDSLNVKISSSYIYAPRFLSSMYLFSADKLNNDELDNNIILDEYAAINPILKREIKKIIDCNSLEGMKICNQLLIDTQQRQLNNYRSYLEKNVGSAERIAIVDSLTIGLSAQKLIQKTLKTKVTGLYWCDLSRNISGEYLTSSFTRNFLGGVSDSEAITKNWNFMEFLMTSPELPVKRLTPKGEPIYHEVSNYEEVRRNAYIHVSKQALLFAEDLKSIFGPWNVEFDPKTIINLINLFVDHPEDEDYKYMMNIYHAADSEHSIYLPLFCSTVSFVDFVKSPKASYLKIKSLKWKSKSQRTILNIFKCIKRVRPLRYKVHGLKYINLCFFPNFRRQYLYLNTCLFEKLNWTVSLGKSKSDSK